MIYEKKIFHREDGKEIECLESIDQDACCPTVIYRAHGIINFNAGGGQMGKYPFTFEIPGNNITEAFANFPEAARSAGVAAQAELQEKLAASQQRIVVPGQMPNGRRIHG